MTDQEIIKQAIDLHVHVGPEIIPRKFTVSELIAYEKNKIRGLGVKNHFFPTAGMARLAPSGGDPFILDSVVLNRYTGGFNPDLILASAQLSNRPLIVWFPTLHTEKFLLSQKTEIPSEWLEQTGRTKIKIRPANKIKPLSIFTDNKVISPEVVSVLEAVKECGAILATGHLAWQDSCELIKRANKLALEKIIITHPIYQKIAMPVDIQKDLAALGAKIEHCYSMYSIDKVPVRSIASQIKNVGAGNCILSSDVGQSFSKSPSEALAEFIPLLYSAGITTEEAAVMLIDNPSFLSSLS